MFAFAQRSGAMKAPVGLLSDRTVLRSKMEGPRPDKFAFAKRSAAMKAPVGLLSDRTVLRSKMEGPCPDKFAFGVRIGCVVDECRPAKSCITKRIYGSANGQLKLSTAEEITVKNMEVSL